MRFDKVTYYLNVFNDKLVTFETKMNELTSRIDAIESANYDKKLADLDTEFQDRLVRLENKIYKRLKVV
jgi:hypothetical protein